MSKHTKGKWEVSGENKTFVYALNEKGTNSFSLNINNDGKTSIQEQQANAKLIAHAPEMINLLIELKETMRGFDGWSDEYNKISKLIKSATEL